MRWRVQAKVRRREIRPAASVSWSSLSNTPWPAATGVNLSLFIDVEGGLNCFFGLHCDEDQEHQRCGIFSPPKPRDQVQSCAYEGGSGHVRAGECLGDVSSQRRAAKGDIDLAFA